jgi:hypothetical protein
MIRAIEASDPKQLENFCDSFEGLLKQKANFFANYQSEKTGETMLHRALQMDFEKGSPGYIAELPKEDAEAASQGEQGVGDFVMGPIKAMMQRR